MTKWQRMIAWIYRHKVRPWLRPREDRRQRALERAHDRLLDDSDYWTGDRSMTAEERRAVIDMMRQRDTP